MRKICSLLLGICLLLTLCVPARADVIMEPSGDSYYKNHKNEFCGFGQVMYLNSPTGTVSLYQSPGGKVLDTVENGGSFYAEYLVNTEKNGTWYWGSTLVGGEYGEAYVRTEDMLNRYDDEFLEDHKDELLSDAPWELSAFTASERLVLWNYPSGTFSEESNWLGENLPGFSWYYLDAEGNIWGYCRYWMGRKGFWLCCTDLGSTALAKPEIYTGTPYFGENAAPLQPVSDPAPESGPSALVYILPSAAVLLSGGLLLLWPKKKSQKTSNNS